MPNPKHPSDQQLKTEALAAAHPYMESATEAKVAVLKYERTLAEQHGGGLDEHGFANAKTMTKEEADKRAELAWTLEHKFGDMDSAIITALVKAHGKGPTENTQIDQQGWNEQVSKIDGIVDKNAEARLKAHEHEHHAPVVPPMTTPGQQKQVMGQGKV